MSTADVSYVPGTLTAVTGDQCWALVEIPPNSPAVTRIWQQLGQGVAADALLAGLLADGIGGTPGFTLLVAGPGGQHRLFCRGTVGATVITGAPGTRGPDARGPDARGSDARGSDARGQDASARDASVPGGRAVGAGQAVATRIDGAGLLTWREQLVDGAERIFLGAPPAETSLRLPATSGVLLAGCVVIDLTSLPARDAVLLARDPGLPARDASLPARDAPARPPGNSPDAVTVSHPALPARPPGPAAAGPMPAGGMPTAPIPASPGPVGPVPAGPLPAGPLPAGPLPAEPPNQPPAPRSEPLPRAEAAARAEPVPRSDPAARPDPAPGAPAPAASHRELPEFAMRITPPDRIGPVVPALLCPGGHVNPPGGRACRWCHYEDMTMRD